MPVARMDLSNQFLIAMPGMVDQFFAGAVVYMCEHTEKGALGLVINKPIDITLKNLFEKVELSLDREALAEQPVYYGGPVQTERGFVLHEAQAEGEESLYTSTLLVPGGLQMTTSKDVLEALANGAGPQRVLITLGYSGWGAGQLEDELKRNGWLTVDANREVIFDTPVAQRYDRALSLLGLGMPEHGLAPTLPTFPHRTYLAFDFGLRRVGVACGNSLTGTAQPLATVAREGDARFAAIERVLKEWQPSGLVVGVPRHPDGNAHEMTLRAQRFGRQLHGRFNLPVFEVDERYTSVEAESLGAKDVDAMSAVLILEQFFNEVVHE
ncbi:hypothetical protein B566_EDAN018953 [Ephemera danica]|nr:hypothetical protein B566_EDAN018953 [Ephemera danica]